MDVHIAAAYIFKKQEKLGISQEKLDLLPVWHEAKCFTNEEKAAFDWCESITHLEKHFENAKERLLTYFNEREIVDLQLVSLL